ncbi:hypothetical protein [Rhizobium hidalgonense]|nr:hypothetical protein [Rhizobium hidalgonense]
MQRIAELISSLIEIANATTEKIIPQIRGLLFRAVGVHFGKAV